MQMLNTNIFNQLISHLKKKPLRFVIGGVITLICTMHAVGVLRLPGVGLLEQHFYDLKVSLSTVKEKDTRIAILDIDEQSLAQFGHWPWGRTLMAKLNDKLFDEQKIAVLGYDIVWAEPDAANPVNILKQLDQEQLKSISANYTQLVDQLQSKNPDRLFAESMKDRQVVLGYYFNNEQHAATANVLPKPVLAGKDLPDDVHQIMRWKTYTGNLSELSQAAPAGGYFNPMVDDDGIIRRMPLLAEHQGHFYQSLSLGMVRAALGSPALTPLIVTDKDAGYSQLEALSLGPLEIPIAPDATAFIPYRGKQHSFDYFSAADVLTGKLPAGALEGKIMIMGSSAPGLRDQRATPLESVYPGVEIHANMIAGILDGNIKYTPSYAQVLEVLQVFFAGLMVTLILPFVGAIFSTIIVAVMIALGVVFNFFLWQQLNLVLPLALSIVTIVLIYVGNLLAGYFVETRLKKQMSGLFSQYVPAELVEKMAEDPKSYGMQGKDATLTILFSDIRGFTGIAEQLSATDLTAYVNEYFNTMTAIIMKEMGTLDKYIGDAIMAFWGAPIDNPRHAYYALRAAFGMRDAARALSESFAARGMPPFSIGIGLNCGNVRVGDMGSDLRRSYTVMGDPVNLTSRLEGLTKLYSADILVTSFVVDMVPEFEYRKVDRVRVKGKNIAVTIYEPIGASDALSHEVKQSLFAWEEALEFYFQRDWVQFIDRLSEIRQSFGNHPIYDLYETRVAFYQENTPPEDWDGVTTMTSK